MHANQDQAYLRHAVREHERHLDEQRIRRPVAAAATLWTSAQVLKPGQIERLTVNRPDRLGVFIHDDSHAA